MRTGKPLWDGAVPLTDAAAGSPYGIQGVPGTDLGLQLLLRKEPDGTGVVLILPYRVVGTNPDGTPIPQNFTPLALAKGETGVASDIGLSIELRDVGEYTLLIAKRDPGQGLIWLAFAFLIAGITITFYRPRRRVWTRLTPDGRLGIVWRSDRYVDVEREFGRLLDQLVAARRTGLRPARWPTAVARRRPATSAVNAAVAVLNRNLPRWYRPTCASWAPARAPTDRHSHQVSTGDP